MLLLPAFTVIDHVTPERVPLLIEKIINHAPTNTSPLVPFTLPKTVSEAGQNDDSNGEHQDAGKKKAEAEADNASIPPPMTSRPSPHRVLVLLCSQKTRDARCGQSAPLLRKELERHLRPLGLYRDLDDERPGGVGIYFISHVGGHKYSANMMVYRRPDAFGIDGVERAKAEGEVVPTVAEKAEEGKDEGEDVGAAQCIWLARVRPEDCENIVRYTILQGKVVKPESQLRGGFDRGKGLLSW